MADPTQTTGSLDGCRRRAASHTLVGRNTHRSAKTGAPVSLERAPPSARPVPRHGR
jgi:hypothetical protein